MSSHVDPRRRVRSGLSGSRPRVRPRRKSPENTSWYGRRSETTGSLRLISGTTASRHRPEPPECPSVHLAVRPKWILLCGRPTTGGAGDGGRPMSVVRREFITLLAGAAAWPPTARAQQPTMPVVGYLGTGSPPLFARQVRAFHQGLSEMGYVEGRNVAVEYRWADDDYDRLPALATDLISRRVAAIATSTVNAGLAAKAATAVVPIVVLTALDPVANGLVASLAHPEGNITGVTSLNIDV